MKLVKFLTLRKKLFLQLVSTSLQEIFKIRDSKTLTGIIALETLKSRRSKIFLFLIKWKETYIPSNNKTLWRPPIWYFNLTPLRIHRSQRRTWIRFFKMGLTTSLFLTLWTIKAKKGKTKSLILCLVLPTV